MVYKTKGVCSRSIDIELDGDRIKSVKFKKSAEIVEFQRIFCLLLFGTFQAGVFSEGRPDTPSPAL